MDTLRLASTGHRAGGYLLDLAVALPLVALYMIPVIGNLFGGFCLMMYWLMRDLVRPSLGKRAGGLRVTGKDGAAPSTPQLIIRNVTLAAPFIVLMIPIVGHFIGTPVALLALAMESTFISITGRRIGDRLAGTTVLSS